MTTTESCRYRGYEIVPRRQWSPTLRTLRPSKEDALENGKKRIDQVLSFSR